MLHQNLMIANKISIMIKKIKRKRVYVTLLLCFFMFLCKAQTIDKVKILYDFQEKVLLEGSDTINMKEFKNYVDLHKKFEHMPSFQWDINGLKKQGKDRLEKCNGNCKIIAYANIEKYPELKKSELYRKLKYNKKENLYYDVNFATNEINAMYVVNNKGKIISLFPYIHIGADPIVPYMLNKKPKANGFLFND